MKTLKVLLLAGVFTALPLVALAATTIEVGRLKVLVEESAWQSADVVTDDIGVDKGVSGMIRGKSKLLTLKDADGVPVASLLVYASWGSNLSLRITSTCKAPEGFYVRDFTKGRNQAPECLVIGPPVMSSQILQSGWLPRLKKVDAADSLAVPVEGYLLRSSFSSNNGSTIDIEGVLSVDFPGLENGKPGAPTGEIPDPVAAWGDALGEAARKALFSMSGELRMPPVGMGTPAR